MPYLMADIDGFEVTAGDRAFLSHPAVAGVTLFARNYADPAQLAALVDDLHALRAQRPLLVAVDQEGGRVQRFVDGFTRLPAMGALGERHEEYPDEARELARAVGYVMAAELRQSGVDLSFAPVLDVATVPSAVIGRRSFSAHAEVVVELAGALIDGMSRGGMSAVGKHFPGHGGVGADSHLEQPVDSRTLAEIEQCDLLPYRRLTRALDGVMSGHIAFPAVAPQPATFSTTWLRDTLRDSLGFTGVVFTDDLGMAAANWAGTAPERVAAALEAGCDVALVCNDRPAAEAVVDRLGERPASGDMVAPFRRGMAASAGPDPALVARVAAFSRDCEPAGSGSG